MATPAWLHHGRSFHAVGGNAEAARVAGIRVERVVWIILALALALALALLATFANVGSVFDPHTAVLTLRLPLNMMPLAGMPH